MSPALDSAGRHVAAGHDAARADDDAAPAGVVAFVPCSRDRRWPRTPLCYGTADRSRPAGSRALVDVEALERAPVLADCAAAIHLEAALVATVTVAAEVTLVTWEHSHASPSTQPPLFQQLARQRLAKSVKKSVHRSAWPGQHTRPTRKLSRNPRRYARGTPEGPAHHRVQREIRRTPGIPRIVVREPGLIRDVRAEVGTPAAVVERCVPVRAEVVFPALRVVLRDVQGFDRAVILRGSVTVVVGRRPPREEMGEEDVGVPGDVQGAG